ncbi:MAG: 50S ribosomal protein L18 [Planctomycetaceae bacterium]|nr:50S ribosomal protein L18 [Planctomycetaceae bacterium]
MKLQKRIAKQRTRRRFRVRNQVRNPRVGRARLSIFRSNKHIYAQVIDDVAGCTLCAASTREADVCPAGESGGNRAAAVKVGQAIAERAKAKGIEQVVFDRGVFRYHGRVAALADAARAGGLDF